MGIFLQLSKSSSGFGKLNSLPILFKISKRGQKCYLILGILQYQKIFELTDRKGRDIILKNRKVRIYLS
jgi:hypothetical protein